MKRNLELKTNISSKLTLRNLLLLFSAAAVIGVIVFLILFFIFNFWNSPASEGSVGISYTTKSSGAWDNPRTWGISSHPNSNSILPGTNLNIASNNEVYIDGDLNLNKDVNLIIDGSLVVNGNINSSQNASIEVRENGVLVVSGNNNLNKEITILNTGVIADLGNMNISIPDITNIGKFYSDNITFTEPYPTTARVEMANDDDLYSLLSKYNLIITTLPVSLSHFRAEVSNKSIYLHWVTETEKNNDFFTIERSSDGINYEEVTVISGAGNSSEGIEYSYTDEDPISGKSFYRLSQTDFNGDFKSFKPIAVNFEKELRITSASPNPFSNRFTISCFSHEPSNALLTVTDIKGNLAYNEKLELKYGNNEYTINTLDKMGKGIYLLSLTKDNGNGAVIKLIKN